MKHCSLKTSLIAVAASALLAACQSTPSGTAPLDELSTSEGLTKVDSKAVDLLYRRPNASLAGYSKFLIKPVEVQFAKNWDPDRNGSGSVLYRMSEVDREKIKADLANAFVEVFKEEMAKGGYSLVTQSGEDVLEIQAALVNLYINAPDPSQYAGQVKVYTTDAGEMTLLMQLHDSVTGQLLARALDREAASHQFWNWTTSVSNTADAKRIIDGWATSLRKALDAARS
jgi:hypothetical protein